MLLEEWKELLVLVDILSLLLQYLSIHRTFYLVLSLNDVVLKVTSRALS
jgi:hypothetical protein